MSIVQRPGITPAFLAENSVTHVTSDEALRRCGCPASGLIIPYYNENREPIHDPSDKPFCRLRRDVPLAGYKYHQPAGTKTHVYLPKNWQAELQADDLIVIEGEFKSLSLTDPNHSFSVPAVGISGFFGFQVSTQAEGEPTCRSLAPELKSALSAQMPQRIIFIGDSDTSLNHDFSVAAIRLQQLAVPSYPLVFLLRINLDEPKGIDDCRHVKRDKFEIWFRSRLDEAMEVKPEMTPDSLAFTLLKSQIDFLNRMSPEEKIAVFERLVTLLAKTEEFTRQQMFELLKKPLGVGKTELKKMVDGRRREMAESQKAESEITIRNLVKNRYFFDGKGYYKRNLDDSYFPLAGRDNILLHLREEHQLLGPQAERALYLIQAEQQVSFAGNVAGHDAGIYRSGQNTILVTASPKPTLSPPPEEQLPNGETGGKLIHFLETFFGKGVDPLWERQRDTFFGYLHFARLGLDDPETALQGQVLVLLGNPGIGKSLVQETIITPLLGGRQADPSDAFLGKTNFNDDLIGAEHLCLSDGAIDSDVKVREQFRGQLKRQVANQTKGWTKKYAGRTHVKPIQRMTMSANLDALGLSVIPTLDSSIRDKIILLKCYPPDGLPTSEAQSRRTFMEMIRDSLPGLAFVVDNFNVPEALEDDRFGIAAFHHPEILQATNQQDPVRPLQGLLETFLKENPSASGGGRTAKEWWEVLKERFGESFTKIADDQRALGRQLGELIALPAWNRRIDNTGRKQYGDQGNYSTVWVIRPKDEAGL